MKFARHLLAASAVVGLIVALGFVWSWSGAASLMTDGRGDHDRAAVTVDQTGASSAPESRRFDERRGDGGMSLSNAGDLAQTLLVEGVIIGGVIAIDRVRRRRKRAGVSHRQMQPS
jgi:hypothetical protein